MLFAAKSTGTLGADSPLPGPPSFGLAIWAVRSPFEWPIKTAKRDTASGTKELGAIALSLNP